MYIQSGLQLYIYRESNQISAQIKNAHKKYAASINHGSDQYIYTYSQD